VSETLHSLGHVDILFNDAGLQCISPVLEYPKDRWEYLLRVMLTAPFLLIKAALPSIVASRWGRIINMGCGGAASEKTPVRRWRESTRARPEGGTVVTPGGRGAGSVYIRDGRIAAMFANGPGSIRAWTCSGPTAS
jgi:NAD(P)-dependent dehydrogenase (short-subunit alcohol dehydrogenase family)